MWDAKSNRVNQNIKERQYLTEDEIKAVMTH